MSAGFFYEMRRDMRAAFNALHATVRGLLTRGQSLESLSDQSDDLVRASIIFKARAECARQELEARMRTVYNRQQRQRLICCCVCCIVFGSIVYLW